MKVSIVYGSSTGKTEYAADLLQIQFPGSRVFNVVDADVAELETSDVLLLGTSTWGTGELQDDWQDFLPTLEAVDLSRKVVAFFGLGDQVSFPDTYANALGLLFDRFGSRAAKVVGFTSPEGYTFDVSLALRGGEFVGLALDDDNQGYLTETRIEAWAKLLRSELGLS